MCFMLIQKYIRDITTSKNIKDNDYIHSSIEVHVCMCMSYEPNTANERQSDLTLSLIQKKKGVLSYLHPSKVMKFLVLKISTIFKN